MTYTFVHLLAEVPPFPDKDAPASEWRAWRLQHANNMIAVYNRRFATNYIAKEGLSKIEVVLELQP